MTGRDEVMARLFRWSSRAGRRLRGGGGGRGCRWRFRSGRGGGSARRRGSRSPSRPPGTKPSPPTWPGWPACTALPQASCGSRSAARSRAPAGATSIPSGWPRSLAAWLSISRGRCPSCAAPRRTGRPGGTSRSRAARAATPGTTAARSPGCCRTTATCASGTGTGSARRMPGSPPPRSAPNSPASSRRNGATCGRCAVTAPRPPTTRC